MALLRSQGVIEESSGERLKKRHKSLSEGSLAGQTVVFNALTALLLAYVIDSNSVS